MVSSAFRTGYKKLRRNVCSHLCYAPHRVDTRNNKNFEITVADILADVRQNGDEAVLQYCAKLDKAQLDALEVSPQEITEAMACVEPEFLEILKEAAATTSISCPSPPTVTVTLWRCG